MQPNYVPYCLLGLTLSLIFTFQVSAAPAQPEGRADNGGRRIALVVPRIAPAPMLTGSANRRSQTVSPVWTGAAANGADPLRQPGTNFGLPERVAAWPKTVAPVVSVTTVITGSSFRRARDTATWLGMLWQSVNDYPRLSPASSFLQPDAMVRSGKPTSLSVKAQRPLY